MSVVFDSEKSTEHLLFNQFFLSSAQSVEKRLVSYARLELSSVATICGILRKIKLQKHFWPVMMKTSFLLFYSLVQSSHLAWQVKRDVIADLFWHILHGASEHEASHQVLHARRTRRGIQNSVVHFHKT